MSHPEFGTVVHMTAAVEISCSIWPKPVRQRTTAPIVRIGAIQRLPRKAFQAWLRQHKAQNT